MKLLKHKRTLFLSLGSFLLGAFSTFSFLTADLLLADALKQSGWLDDDEQKPALESEWDFKEEYKEDHKIADQKPEFKADELPFEVGAEPDWYKEELKLAAPCQDFIDIGRQAEVDDQMMAKINDLNNLCKDKLANASMTAVNDILASMWQELDVLLQVEGANAKKNESTHQFSTFDFTQPCNDFSKEAEKMMQEGMTSKVVKQIEQLADRCRADINNLSEKLKDANKAADAQIALDNMMNDLWVEFEELLQAHWSRQDCDEVSQQLAEMDQDLNKEAATTIKQVRATDPKIADALENLLQEAKQVLNKSQQALKEGACETALKHLDTLHFEIGDQFERLISQTSLKDEFKPTLGDLADDYADAYQALELDEHGKLKPAAVTEHLKKEQYGTQDLQLLKQLPPTVVADYLQTQVDGKQADVLPAAAAADFSVSEIRELLQLKNDLVKEVTTLRTQADQLKQELQSVLAAVEQYNFGTNTSREAKQFIKHELVTLSPRQAQLRFESLKQQARQEKFTSGLIPFTDTDDDQWYTAAAASAKQAGLVQGTGESGGTKLDPARSTNLAEAVTLFARIKGVNLQAQAQSNLGKSLPTWAQAAAGTLAAGGIDLDQIFPRGTKPEAGVTRGQVARLLQLVLNLPVSDDAKAHSFNDFNLATTAEKTAIAAVYKADLMKGYRDGSGRFGINDVLNRAELVTVLERALEFDRYR